MSAAVTTTDPEPDQAADVAADYRQLARIRYRIEQTEQLLKDLYSQRRTVIGRLLARGEKQATVAASSA